MADVDDVAAAILAAAGPMTAKKLEKLVYYSQAWHLAWRERPLFSDTIEAWAQGPAVRRLYDQHRRQYQVREWRSGDRSRLSPDEWHTVEWVVGRYGSFTAEALSRMTHNDSPWQVARGALPWPCPRMRDLMRLLATTPWLPSILVNRPTRRPPCNWRRQMPLWKAWSSTPIGN